MYKVPGQHEHNGIQFAAMYPDEVLDKLPEEFKFRSDDVLIASFPKSGKCLKFVTIPSNYHEFMLNKYFKSFIHAVGRIWLEEVVWLLCNNADFEEAGKKNLRLRLPPIEIKVEIQFNQSI